MAFAHKEPGEVDAASAFPTRTASMLADSMSETLFGQDPPLPRHRTEMQLRLRIGQWWRELERMRLPEWAVRDKLQRLDGWAAKRLSGRNVLLLAMQAEREHPEWIPFMPKLLASRYEELKIARIWSALLNPKALSRLRLAIEAERTLGEME